MSISVRLMTASDVEAAARLYQANARDAVAPELRAERGFVQGKLTPERLGAAARDGHAFVAELEGQLAGATMTHPVERFESADQNPGLAQSPPALTVKLIRQAGITDPILYGPSVVADTFRRRGVLSALVEFVLKTAAGAGYHTAVAFMELENIPSVKAHANLGWQPIGGFTYQDREYEVVIHPVGQLDS